MSTNDVPGANPANRDKLSRGCWAEHSDGSLIYVKDIDENDRIIFEMYDFKDPSHPVYYPHAMAKRDFEEAFSYSKKKSGKDLIIWKWHDKTPMPWEKIMRVIDRPLPVAANVEDTVSAASRMAESLQTRLRENLTKQHAEEEAGISSPVSAHQAKNLFDKIKRAIHELTAD